MTNDVMTISKNSLSQISKEIINKGNVYFKFTKILISDGTFPLTDSSNEVKGHIYKYIITEISRTGNNILLTAQIEDTTKISIKEIGLYYEDDDGSHLFSLINDLNLKSKKTLSYNLVFHIKLDINVVNTIAFPEIITKGGSIPPSSDFRTIQQIYTYVLINLERLIKLNAIGIGQYTGGSQATINPAIMSNIKPVGVGYNKAQVLYRFLKELANFKDNFTAVNNYGTVQNTFTPHTTFNLNFNSFIEEGDVQIIQNIAQNFSETSYIEVTNPYYVPSQASWEYDITFTTNSDILTDQTIVNFARTALTQPLILNITDEDNEGYCHLSMGEPDSIQIQKSLYNYTFTRSSDVTIDNTSYYAWTSPESMGLNPQIKVEENPYFPLIINNGVISSFVSAVKTNKNINPLINSSWTINLTFTTGGDTLEGYCLLSTPERGLRLSVYNEGLELCLSSDRTNWDIANAVQSTGLTVLPNTNYSISISFNNESDKYTVNLVNNDTGESRDVITIISSTPTLIANYIYLGKFSEEMLYFNGSIDLKNSNIYINEELIWSGISNLNLILTKNYIITNETVFYDNRGTEISDISFIQQNSGTFINQNLFPIEAHSTYNVKIKYNYNYNNYIVEYSQDGINYSEVLNKTSTNTLINPDNVYYGAQFTNTGFTNPFLGSLQLDKISMSYNIKDNYGNIIASEVLDFLEYTEKNTTLTDYFHIPSYAYSHSYFTIRNLNDSSSSLGVLEGAIKGNRVDSINFLQENGFSLVIKLTLNNTESKMILAKGSIEQENYYFTLEQVNYGENSERNNDIIFTLYLPYQTITMSKELTPEILRDYTNFPITLTITCDGNSSLKMYKNTELIASTTFEPEEWQPPTSIYITNRTSMNHEDSLEEQVVHDILCFNGELQTEDIFYITNILATNF